MRSLPISSNGYWDITAKTAYYVASHGYGAGGDASTIFSTIDQNYIYVKVRPPYRTMKSRVAPTSRTWTVVNETIGNKFTLDYHFDRLRIPVNGNGQDIILTLYESEIKNTIYFSIKFNTIPNNSYLEVAFDYLPPGTYYWEVSQPSNNISFQLLTGGSGFGYAYIDGVQQTGKDFDFKYYTYLDSFDEVFILPSNQEINGGNTIKNDFENLCKCYDLNGVEKEIITVGTKTTDGGIINSGAWYCVKDTLFLIGPCDIMPCFNITPIKVTPVIPEKIKISIKVTPAIPEKIETPIKTVLETAHILVEPLEPPP